MTIRIYILEDTLEQTRREFENFLIDYIIENELDLRNLTGVSIERSVKHHPLRLAREIGFKVNTYLTKVEM